MRTFLPIAALFALVFSCFLFPAAAQAQPAAPESYLLVWFEHDDDKVSRRSFVRLKAERGCDSARRVYALLEYDPKNWTPAEDKKFFHRNRNPGDSVNNYFLSPTEGLNYLSLLGWRLVSAFPQTTSGATNERVVGTTDLVPVTTISSYPVFCLKK